MALSGSFGNTFRTGYRLQVDWSATQNIESNQSTITAKLYWRSLGSSYTVNSTATKTAYLTIGNSGTTNTSSAGLADLDGNEKKLIYTKIYTVTHAADGKYSGDIIGKFDCAVTLGSTFYSSVITSDTITLDTIPRASNITSSANWTAGNNLTVNIASASTTFTHRVRVYVNNGTSDQLVRDVNDIKTSVGTGFSFAENETIFGYMNTNVTRPTRVIVDTFNGSTFIGSDNIAGTITAPSASTVSASDFIIGNVQPCTITEANSNFTHTLVFTFGSITKTITKTTSLEPVFVFDSTEINNLYAQTPNANSRTGTVSITTFWGNQQVRTATTDVFTATVSSNNNPIFGATYTYKDINPTTNTLTGNDQYIIRSKSIVLVEIPPAARAIPTNGATMVSYQATLNGITKSAAWSSSETISFNFGVINSSTNLTLSIKAIDSRGNSTTTSQIIIMTPYSNPVVNAKATRQNNFEAPTTITLNGSISPLTVNRIDKNTLLTSTTLVASAIAFDTNIPNYVKGTAYHMTVALASRAAFDAAGVKIGDFITNGGALSSRLGTITVINGYTLTVVAEMDLIDSTPLTYDGENIGRPGALQYRYKAQTDSNFPATGPGSWTDFVFTTSGANYTATNVTITLDNLSVWNVEIKATDALGTTTIPLTVPVGQPILFIEGVKKSVGVNRFPTDTGVFEVSGDVLLYSGTSKFSLASTAKHVDTQAINVLAPPPPFVAAKGDGVTNDSPAIQSMLNAFSNKGMKLIFPLATYLIGTKLDPLTSKVHFIGAKGTVFKLGTTSGMVDATGRSDIIFENIIFDGNNLVLTAELLGFYTSNNIVIDSCSIINTKHHGILAYETSLTIKDTTITGTTKEAIRIDSSKPVIVERCTITNSVNAAIEVANGGTVKYVGHIFRNNVITTVTSTGGTGENGNGIVVEKINGVMCTNNIITGAAWSAIRLNNSGDAIISGNRVNNAGDWALYAEFGGNNIVISDNLIINSNGGISCTNADLNGRRMTVSGNILKNITNAAIDCEDSTVVTGNNIDGAIWGIRMGWGSYGKNLIVTSNIITDTKTTPTLKVGIVVNTNPTNSDFIIAQNIVKNYINHGICGADLSVSSTLTNTPAFAIKANNIPTPF